MKLLFLSKRRPQGRDLITRPYGRFYHLPVCLARRGHEVTCHVLDYQGADAVETTMDGVRWLSDPLFSGSNGGYLKSLHRLAGEIRPDWIVGCSDTYFGILARYFAKKYSARCCIDAYDNYESYMRWNWPLHKLWRKALAGADLVTAAGPGLLERMSVARGGKPGAVVPMAADPDLFVPLDRANCRQELDLPAAVPLVGYSGSLYRNRGIDVLFSAFELLRRRVPGAQLVLSGRRGRNVRIPAHAHWLGYLDDSRMPVLLNSMNVVAVVNRLSAFGEYSYPVKLYEAMACKVPVVATRTGATAWILADHPECLADAGNAAELAMRLAEQIDHAAGDCVTTTDWESSSIRFEEALQQVSG